MKRCIALACVALAHGIDDLKAQVLDVPDFFHYLRNTQAGVAMTANGIKVQKWNAIGGEEGYHEGTLRPPMLEKISIPKGVKYGFTTPGTVYTPAKTGPFWLTSPAHYVVTKGKVKVWYVNSTGPQTVRLSTGDMFYAPAGMKHGPFKASGGGRAVMLALADFPPKNGETPGPLGAVVEPFAFQPRDSDYGPPPPIGLPDCIKIFPGPGVIAAKMEPNCRLPYHFHATGAFYFFTKGALKVGGDIPNKIVTFPAGTSRWARPAWAYGPELSVNEWTYFLVLGLPPTVGAAPNTPQQVIRDELAQPAQVIYRNTQVGKTVIPGAGYEKSGEKPALRQKRARRHLRSSVGTDGEETVLLQSPYLLEEDMEEEMETEEEMQEEL